MQPPLDLPAIEYAERSDPGRDPAKQVNEDVCGHRETRFGHLCVVCDGMGGHAAGREAAELALSTIFEMFEQAPPGAAPADVLRSAIEEASRRIHTMPTEEAALGRPGSTVVAIVMHAHGTDVAHVGDSRAYLVHEGQIFRVTRDHSVVQEMVDRGLLTAAQAAHHPDANRITRALGMAPEVEADVRPQPVLHVTGDAFMLCSDGLSDLVEDQEILEVVGSVPPAQAVSQLVDVANARGGHDNITVVVLRARTTAYASASTSAVAPTVAQTSVPQAVQTIAAGATLVDAPRDRPTEVPLPTGPLEPTIPPPAPTRRVSPVVASGIALASIAMASLVGVLVVHFADRSGKRSSPSALEQAFDAGVAAEARAPTPLLPGSVVLPPAESSPPGDRLAPLEPLDPGPDPGHVRRRPLAPHDKGKQ
jgi:PPM family protein phosphatase